MIKLKDLLNHLSEKSTGKQSDLINSMNKKNHEIFSDLSSETLVS